MFGIYKDGKFQWPVIRQIGYVALFTWLVGVRLLGINPFDDFTEGKDPSLATVLDALSLIGIYAFSWHVMWPMRPKLG
jgi:hypothetical protein